MMSASSNNHKDELPSGELGPQLRNAVEHVLDDPIPEALMSRTLDRMKQQSPTVSPVATRPSRLGLVIALAAAACLVGVAVWVTSQRRAADPSEFAETSNSDRPIDGTAKTNQEPNPQPTIWAYQQLLREQPESLDDLLDAHANRLGNADPQSLHLNISL